MVMFVLHGLLLVTVIGLPPCFTWSLLVVVLMNTGKS